MRVNFTRDDKRYSELYNQIEEETDDSKKIELIFEYTDLEIHHYAVREEWNISNSKDMIAQVNRSMLCFLTAGYYWYFYFRLGAIISVDRFGFIWNDEDVVCSEMKTQLYAR